MTTGEWEVQRSITDWVIMALTIAALIMSVIALIIASNQSVAVVESHSQSTTMQTRNTVPDNAGKGQTVCAEPTTEAIDPNGEWETVLVCK